MPAAPSPLPRPPLSRPPRLEKRLTLGQIPCLNQNWSPGSNSPLLLPYSPNQTCCPLQYLSSGIRHRCREAAPLDQSGQDALQQVSYGKESCRYNERISLYIVVVMSLKKPEFRHRMNVVLLEFVSQAINIYHVLCLYIHMNNHNVIVTYKHSHNYLPRVLRSSTCL